MKRIRAARRGRTGNCCLGAAAAMIIAGCAGSGKGLDANGQPLGPGGTGGSIPLSADFDSLQANIFTPICSVCHAGGGAPQGLRLDAANSYNLLVGVPSTEVPAVLRVKPGDPDNSYVIQKLEGHAAVGARMPLGGPYLSSTTIAFVRAWITNGAQLSAAASTSAAAAVSAPLAVVIRAPEMNEFVSEPPPQIMIGFNRDLDATRIDAQSARIEQLFSDNGGLRIEEIPARVTVSAVNPRALMVWPGRVLDVGRYRVMMRAADDDTGDSVVTAFEVETLP